MSSPINLGGSTGCVIAGRLANLDPNLTVLLIEGGENNLNNPWVFRPGIYPCNMKLDSRTASFYHSRPSEHLGGRKAIVPCAHVLGGGSSINFMVCGLFIRSKKAILTYSPDIAICRCIPALLPAIMTISKLKGGLQKT